MAGTRFAVWAPNAQEVSVACDANHWQHGRNPLARIDDGIWTGFVPGLVHGGTYKFSLRDAWGNVQQKADPFAFAAELRPKSASIVCDLGNFRWHDQPWLRRREMTNWYEQPITTYEVHLGSWRNPTDGRRFFNYRELAHMLVDYVRQLGYTHIQLLPVTEHPFDGSWGYQTVGYFAPTSRFGSPHDFMYFVDHCHQNNIGVLVDWVPAHFPTDGHGLARFDGTCLYEHADPRQGSHPDWGTLVFNYGRNEVRNFLLSNALWWLEEYHVDGVRVDAVASMLYLDYSRRDGEWIPNQYGGRENIEAIEFLRQLNTLSHGEHPGTITAAEESTAWPGVSRPVHLGGLGFTYKWNMGWMHDVLEYAHKEPVHRRWEHNLITFSALYMFTENFILPLSHDEVVHGKGSLLDKIPGDLWQKYASLRTLYGYMYGHPGKKLLFMGSEFGQWREWHHDESLDWHLLDDPAHAALRRYVQALNWHYRAEPALHQLDFDPSGFRWIDCNDNENSVVSFVRYARNPSDFVVMLLNFTPVPRRDYRIGVPAPGYYVERLNSDSALFGGGNLGNGGGVNTEPIATHGFDQSLALIVPPLACLLLKKQ
jgi:1,4-alpha-glucan branching enzyme